jgi:hypothetical protein
MRTRRRIALTNLRVTAGPAAAPLIGAALVTLAGLGANPTLASAAVLLAAGVVAQASFWMARNQTAESEDASEEASVAAVE